MNVSAAPLFDLAADPSRDNERVYIHVSNRDNRNARRASHPSRNYERKKKRRERSKEREKEGGGGQGDSRI